MMALMVGDSCQAREDRFSMADPTTRAEEGHEEQENERGWG